VQVGFDVIVERRRLAAEGLPGDIVYGYDESAATVLRQRVAGFLDSIG
jgi:hypothetical protein